MIARAFVAAAATLFGLATPPAMAQGPATTQGPATAQGPATTQGPATSPPALETFFRPPRFAGMSLSPDGRSIAALASVGGRQNLVIVDHVTKEARPVSSLTDRDVVWFAWVNDRRLILRTGSLGERDADARGGGLFAVDRDGGASRQLAEGIDEMKGAAIRFTARPTVFLRRLDGGGDDVIVQELVAEPGRVSSGGLFRLDTRTGRRKALSTGAPASGEGEHWVVDGSGAARALKVTSRNTVAVYFRALADGPWEKLDEHPADRPGWHPIAIDGDGRSLIASWQKDRDRAAIVRYDTQARAVAEVLAEHPQVDLREAVMDGDRVVGVRYEADREATAWFDPALARIQDGVDKAFPDSVNRLSWSADRQRVLVAQRSDRSPGAFHLLDRQTGRIEWLADRAAWIRPEEMAAMRPVRYPARDGLEIPAYLTVPRGSAGKDLPLVVLVHGGPWVNGAQWRFDPEVQFLASRGYAVLQPNFRGTTRYGWKHFSSSFGQWGLAMQDDLEDGVRWAVREGVADGRRVCIAGASYGGYAAMMGLAKTPGLYRCGINWVGVTDLRLLFTAAWSDGAYSDFIQYRAKDMIGDPDRDRDRLAAVSPVQQAAKIRAPVLLAYGAQDRRVPLQHGTDLRSALEAAGGNVEWLLFEGEGHGFRKPENRRRFYQSVERFLARHLAGPRP